MRRVVLYGVVVLLNIIFLGRMLVGLDDAISRNSGITNSSSVGNK